MENVRDVINNGLMQRWAYTRVGIYPGGLLFTGSQWSFTASIERTFKIKYPPPFCVLNFFVTENVLPVIVVILFNFVIMIS